MLIKILSFGKSVQSEFTPLQRTNNAVCGRGLVVHQDLSVPSPSDLSLFMNLLRAAKGTCSKLYRNSAVCLPLCLFLIDIRNRSVNLSADSARVSCLMRGLANRTQSGLLSVGQTASVHFCPAPCFLEWDVRPSQRAAFIMYLEARRSSELDGTQRTGCPAGARVVCAQAGAAWY